MLVWKESYDSTFFIVMEYSVSPMATWYLISYLAVHMGTGNKIGIYFLLLLWKKFAIYISFLKDYLPANEGTVSFYIIHHIVVLIIFFSINKAFISMLNSHHLIHVLWSLCIAYKKFILQEAIRLKKANFLRKSWNTECIVLK